MPRRFVLLDRDGTLIAKRLYLSDPAGVELLPNAVEGLKAMRELELGLILITNQSGVGRGYFDLDQVHAVHDRLGRLLAADGIVLDDILFCPHHPDDGCGCRKPATGMVEKAAARWGFAPAQSFLIGDAECDLALGKALGSYTVRTIQDPNGESGSSWAVQADATVGDLLEAALLFRRLVADADAQSDVPEQSSRVDGLCKRD